MKTKHLFYTMALAASFAACTNEEFLTNASQENFKVDRPVVSNVTLEVENDNADTRLGYVSGDFKWEDGDKIAALLMDENNTGKRYGSATETENWNKLSWMERYHLVDYVHTNFAFAYDEATDKWNSTGNCNMLEGNYFLAYPYVSFDGKRQAYYNIGNQKQVGNTAEGRKKAFTDNQKFVGYAQLEATAGATKLSTKLAGVLAAVRINIQSNCTEVTDEPLEVNKIVLANDNFSSHYSIDPTEATYGKWNLTKLINDDNDKNVLPKTYFNYANYLDAAGLKECKKVDLYKHALYGSANDADYVYNIEEGAVGDIDEMYDINPDFNERVDSKYYWDEAIRKAVKPLTKKNWTENTTDYVEVYTYDEYVEDGNGNMVSSKPMLLKSGSANKLGIWAMVPPFDTEHNDTKLYIYTNKGVVGPVNLKVIHQGNSSCSVQTTDALLAAHPNMKTPTITVIIDDDDIVRTPYNMQINNEDDLKNYVAWATANPTASKLEVTLTNDITINDELATAIRGIKKENGILFIKGSKGKEKNVKLAVGEVSENKNILEYIDMQDNALVQVLNGAAVNLTSASHNLLATDASSSKQNVLNIIVDKGGILNIVDSNKPGVDGWGSTNVARYCDIKLTNEGGTINVKAETVVKNTGIRLLNKEGNVVVEGESQILLAPGSINFIKGTIEVEKGGELSGTTEENVTNYGDIMNAGELYNVNNALAKLEAEENQKKVRPGYVYITDAGAMTILDKNNGKVIYKVLPEIAVQVKDNDYHQGIFEYETEADTEVSDLVKAHVTDFTIVNATLSVTTLTTNLRHLTVKNGTIVKAEDVDYIPSFNFGVPNVMGAAWNTNDLNTITLMGNTTVENVNFWHINNKATQEGVFLTNDGKNKDITFKGTVCFATSQGIFAKVDLNAVTLTAYEGAIVNVEAFTAQKKVSSTIKVMPNATVEANSLTDKYDKRYITVNGGTIK